MLLFDLDLTCVVSTNQGRRDIFGVVHRLPISGQEWNETREMLQNRCFRFRCVDVLHNITIVHMNNQIINSRTKSCNEIRGEENNCSNI